jgi:hypothetical protein
VPKTGVSPVASSICFFSFAIRICMSSLITRKEARRVPRFKCCKYRAILNRSPEESRKKRNKN